MKRTCVAVLSCLVLGSAPGATTAQPAAGAAWDTVRVEGIEMAYRDVGEGEPLVLLHGFFGTGAMWEPLFDDFADYRLIVPDLRGHGRSTNPSGGFTHRQSARDVYALLDSLGIDRFRGVGSSTGGMTLLHMATDQPERVEQMVLVGATSYFPASAREVMRSMHPDSAPPEAVERMARGHSRGEAQIRELIRAFHDFRDDYTDMTFTPPYLASIEAATLIVHGDRDRFFPVRIPVEQYRSIPDSYLWILPNTGHVPLLGNERGRARFAEVMGGFFAGEWE